MTDNNLWNVIKTGFERVSPTIHALWPEFGAIIAGGFVAWTVLTSILQSLLPSLVSRAVAWVFLCALGSGRQN